MLSVLIPIYNFNIYDLVSQLHKQCEREKIKFEILVFDDGSNQKFKKLNREIANLGNVNYQEEVKNIGRSAIRNKLANTAKYDNLLFLDCDSSIAHENYIKNYLQYCDKKVVVYGGRTYNNEPPFELKYNLHWLHGVKREVIDASQRNTIPNRFFMSNNFLVHKSILDVIQFDDKNIEGYGHEDTLFGYELMKRNILIQHINNPVIHLGLESNEEFLRKTREGIKNLNNILQIKTNDKKFSKEITLLSYYSKIEKLGLRSAVFSIYKKYEYALRKNLMSKKPSLFLFDIYKLGYLCSLNK